MADALIYAATRTAVGTFNGGLARVRSDDLAAVPIRSVVEQSGVDASKIDDVIFGCSNQAGEDNRNVARNALLLAGLPIEVPGMTVNRLCGSGLQAVVSSAQAIRCGDGAVFVAGGVESMTRAPYVMLKPEGPFQRQIPAMAETSVGWRFTNPKLDSNWTVSLGETAELVREKFDISREAQDAFALESQRRAAAAIEEGIFADEITPVVVPPRSKRDQETVFDRDEHPRPGITAEKLARLRPVFRRENGSVTAGNASGINDGAAALVVAAEGSLDTTPLAKVVGSAVVGLDPAYMGLGPIPAIKKLMARTGVALDDVDLFEINEAFAAQAVACVQELGLDQAKVNIYGGGIALGHPLGCTGAKLLVTLVHALKRRKARYGVVSMCIGVGQGIAMLVENTAM